MTATRITPATGLCAMTATELASRIRARDVSSREVVGAHLRRIDETQPDIHAFALVDAEGALAAAAAADDATVRGEGTEPLHGVPVSIKDWIDVAGLTCAGGVALARDRVPARDATVVARLRAAGAVVLGKTAINRDADPATNSQHDAIPAPPVANPHDLARSPGRSSSGECAAIGAGASPLGLGSDSGGSIRYPAHCCGVAGLKPTTGRVPLTGHFPRITAMQDPRTVIGPIARSVPDLALALRIIAGPDRRDPSCVPVPLGDAAAVSPTGMRVAWFAGMPDIETPAWTAAMVAEAARALAERGATVSDAVPPDLGDVWPVTQAHWPRVTSASLEEWMPAIGHTLTPEEIEHSTFLWDRYRRHTLRWMGDYDVVLSPVAADAAQTQEGARDDHIFAYTLPWSLTGWPVVSVPFGVSPEGLPAGVQVIAPAWREDVALAVARVLEEAAP